MTVEILKPVPGPESITEELDPKTQTEGSLQGRSVSVYTPDQEAAFVGFWDCIHSWSLLLPNGAPFYHIKLKDIAGLDVKVVTLFLLTVLLFNSASTRRKEELQRARAIERTRIRAEHIARVHKAFLIGAHRIALEEIIRSHQALHIKRTSIQWA